MLNKYKIEFNLRDIQDDNPMEIDDIRDTIAEAIQDDFEVNDLEVEGEIKITKIEGD